jgi:copper transport protein
MNIRTALCTAVTTLVLACGISGQASAHSLVEWANPSPGARVEKPPSQVVIKFREATEPRFSTVVVVDQHGTVVSGKGKVSANGRQITVAPLRLSRGVYTVKWRILSAVDGHTTASAYSFQVGGLSQTARGVIPIPKKAVEPSTEWIGRTSPPTRIAASIIRWLGFLATFVLVGSAFFLFAVIEARRATAADEMRSASYQAASGRLRKLSFGAAIIALFSLGAELVLTAATLIGTSGFAMFQDGSFWRYLLQTKPGWTQLVRAGLIALFLLPASYFGRYMQAAALSGVVIVGAFAIILGNLQAIAALPHFTLMLYLGAAYALAATTTAAFLPQIPDLRLPRLSWVPFLAGCTLLAASAMVSHGAASGTIALFANWLHLIALSVWVGGLVSLFVTLRGEPPDERAYLAGITVPRFSTVAGISLGVTALTGLYLTIIHVPGISSLTLTNYGKLLMLKLTIISPLVALGAMNKFIFVRKLQAGSAPGLVRTFSRIVSSEVVVAVMVIGVAVALAGTPAPKMATHPKSGTMASESANVAIARTGQAGEFQVNMTLAPGTPGNNRIGVSLSPIRGRMPAGPVRVFVRASRTGDDMMGANIPLRSLNQRSYEGASTALSMTGRWKLEVVVRRAGRPDVSVVFPVQIK